ncbi:MAG: DUF7557 family protein [Candidatus Nezhaarchaeales archaeon]
MSEKEKVKKTTIQVSRELKAELDKLKVHPREPYEDVLKRLVKAYKEKEKSEKLASKYFPLRRRYH